MKIREGDCLLEIIYTESSPPGTPTAGDLRLSVRVSSRGFAGSSPHVWVDLDGFKLFLAQLVELESKRHGTARLEAMSSPDEFWLEIRSIDRAGHVAAFGRLQRWQAMTIGNNGHAHAVEFGFEFCPSRLPTVLKEFKLMISGVA